MLYSLYLREIENDDYEAFEVYEQFNSMRKNLLIRKNEKDEFDMNGSNSHASVIMVSGSKHNMGEVINANNELLELLGYTREAVHGASINRLMPGIIAMEHDRRLMNYIIQNKEKSGLLELIVLAMHKNGIMVPCILKKRIIPNLHDGIQFIGFMCKCNDISQLLDKIKSDEYYGQNIVLFLTDNNWKVYGINEEACQLFNINPEEVNIRKYFYEDEKFTLTKIFPKFTEVFQLPDNMSHSNTSDAVLQVDIMALQNEIGTSIDKNINLDKEDSSRFSKSQIYAPTINVRIYEHLYDSFDNINIRLAAFKFDKGTEDIIKTKGVEEEKSAFMYESQKDKNIEIDFIDNQSQSTSSSAASGVANSRTVKDLKCKIHSQQWTTLLLIFMRMGIILFIILNVLGVALYMERKNNLNNINSMVDKTGKAYYTKDDMLTVPILIREIMGVYG